MRITLLLLFALAVPAAAQIKGLDDRWTFFTGVGDGRGNVKVMTGTGAPSAGPAVTLHAAVSVREEWPGVDGFARRPMWASKVITVGPVGRRLLIDNRLAGRLTVGDKGGEARVAARVTVYRFDTRYGPLAGRQYPGQRSGPAPRRLTAVRTDLVDDARQDDAWLDPGSYVVEVRVLVSAKMTKGLGGDHAVAEFMPGQTGYGYTARFSDGGVTMPRRPARDRSGLGRETHRRADASAVIGGATGQMFFATAVARSDDGGFVLAGSNPLARTASVAVVDAAGTVVSRTAAPAGFAPCTDLAWDPAEGLVFLPLADGRLHCFDPATDLFVASRSVPLARRMGTITALAYDPAGRFFVADGVQGVVLDARDGRQLATLPAPPGLQVAGAAFDPATRTLWWVGTKAGRGVAVRTDATGVPSLELLLCDAPITNGGAITARVVQGRLERGLTFIAAGSGGRGYATVSTTLVYAASDGGRIDVTGRPTRGGRIRVGLDESEGAQALLMFHVDPVAPAPLFPVLGPGSVLALPPGALLLPPIPVAGGRAAVELPVPDRPSVVGLQAAWQWLVVTPSAPLQTSDAATHLVR